MFQDPVSHLRFPDRPFALDPAETYSGHLDLVPDPQMAGKHILLTGAGTGIGAGILIEFLIN